MVQLDSDVIYLGSTDHMVSIATTHLHHHYGKAANESHQQTGTALSQNFLHPNQAAGSSWGTSCYLLATHLFWLSLAV